MQKGILLIKAAFMAVLISCGEDKMDREIWESQNISSYHMKQSISCFCINEGPYRVAVKDDTLYSAVNSYTNEPVDAKNLNLYTVDELFDLIDHAKAHHAEVLKVEFDGVFHFPKKIDIDFSRRAVDDELSIVISDFGVDP